MKIFILGFNFINKRRIKIEENKIKHNIMVSVSFINLASNCIVTIYT
jgi:hypothetical protein